MLPVSGCRCVGHWYYLEERFTTWGSGKIWLLRKLSCKKEPNRTLLICKISHLMIRSDQMISNICGLRIEFCQFHWLSAQKNLTFQGCGEQPGSVLWKAHQWIYHALLKITPQTSAGSLCPGMALSWFGVTSPDLEMSQCTCWERLASL